MIKQSCVKYCKHLGQNIEETSQKEVIDETPNTHSKSLSSKKPNVIPNDKKSFKVPQSVQTNSNTRNKKETLVIGDSTLKGIQFRGLRNNVRVMTCRGKRLLDISTRLGNMNLDIYDSIIVCVGGNDAANKKPIRSLYEELVRLINSVTKKSKVFLCTVCPRKDTEMTPLNDLIKKVCEQLAASLIDCYSSFVYGTGKTAEALCHMDRIHLLPAGTRTLIKVIDKIVSIIKTKLAVKNPGVIRSKEESKNGQRKRVNFNDSQVHQNRRKSGKRCWNCVRSNHFSNECWNVIW